MMYEYESSNNTKHNLIVIGITLLIFTVIGYVGVILQWIT